MMKKTIKQGEQKIINLINEVVDTPNLNFSDIKSKIVIETNKEKEKESKRYFNYTMIKYAVVSLFIVILFATSFITVNVNNRLSSNLELTTYLTDTNLYNDTQWYRNTSFSKTGIYAVMDKVINESNNKLIKVNVPDINDGVIQCAYLSRGIISKIEDYPRGGDYHTFRNKICLYGFDDLLVKYYYYCEKENIDLSQINKELKWMSYEIGDKIDSRINQYQIIFNSHIRDVSDIYDIKNNNSLGINIKCITEIHQVTSNIEDIKFNTLGGEYLFNINSDHNNSLYYTDEYFDNNSALIESINNQKVIKGIIPKWYYTYKNNESINDSYVNNIKILELWMKDLNLYLNHKKENYNTEFQYKVSINYYDYNVIEYLKDY